MSVFEVPISESTISDIATSDITISGLDSTRRGLWDQYVRNSPHGLPQHLSGWRDVLQNTYGYSTDFLLATTHAAEGNGESGDAIVGVMPLYFVRSLLTGRNVATLPGGLCAENAAVARMLIARGRELAAARNAQRLLLQDSRHSWDADLHSSQEHEAWLLHVEPSEEAMMSSIHRNIRRQIRMAQRNELVARVDRTGELLGDFYSVLSRFTHQVGTPVFGLNFLQNIVEAFPDGFNIVVVYKDNAPIGGYFQLEMGTTMYGVWGAALRDYLSLRPVYLAYWTILADCIARGFQQLDMGRSAKDSNASKFKAQWGGVATPIYQQVANLAGDPMPSSPTERVRNDSKYRIFTQLWPKLPFPVAQYLGPKLRRHIPFA